jgi:hypothetical protein
MEVFSPLRDMPTSAYDTSNTINVIGELFLKPLANPVRVSVFPKKKPNNRSLFGLHPAVKNLNIQRHQHFFRIAALSRRGRGCPALVFEMYTGLAIQQCMKLCSEVMAMATPSRPPYIWLLPKLTSATAQIRRWDAENANRFTHSKSCEITPSSG